MRKPIMLHYCDGCGHGVEFEDLGFISDEGSLCVVCYAAEIMKIEEEAA